MIDLEPFKEVMQKNILYLIGLGAIIIAATLFFKKLEKKFDGRNRRKK